MALLGFLGFEHINSAPNPQQWPGFITSTTAGFTKVSGQLQGSAMSVSSGNRDLIWADGNNYITLIVGFRMKTLTAGGTSVCFSLMDGASTQLCLVYGVDGKFRLYRGTPTTNLLATGTIAYSFGSWLWMEFKATINNTTGAYELRIGGVTEFTATNVNTRSTANNQTTGFAISLGSSSGAMDSVDDLYWADTTGSVVNDIVGAPLMVETSIPSTNDSVQWTPLSSTNASNIDDTAYDDDTTYNSDTTSGHIDLFNHGSIVYTPTVIYGVALITRARKDDVAARSLRNKLKSGATTVNGTSVSMDTTYKLVKDYWLTDPATSVAWANAAAVNATKIGYEHV